MTETEYQEEVKRLMKDPRRHPENDWHEQWLIDMQDLDDKMEENHD